MGFWERVSKRKHKTIDDIRREKAERNRKWDEAQQKKNAETDYKNAGGFPKTELEKKYYNKYKQVYKFKQSWTDLERDAVANLMWQRNAKFTELQATGLRSSQVVAHPEYRAITKFYDDFYRKGLPLPSIFEGVRKPEYQPPKKHPLTILKERLMFWNSRADVSVKKFNPKTQKFEDIGTRLKANPKLVQKAKKYQEISADGGYNWQRVLSAFGADFTDAPPMTSKEAWKENKVWRGWREFAKELERLGF